MGGPDRCSSTGEGEVMNDATQAGKPITVIGAGSWGTALAIQLARAGSQVTLWGRDSKHMQLMLEDRCNDRYLPDAPFPENLSIEADWDKALSSNRRVLISVPSHAFRHIIKKLKVTLSSEIRSLELAWATKGFELSTGLLPHQIVRQSGTLIRARFFHHTPCQCPLPIACHSLHLPCSQRQSGS